MAIAAKPVLWIVPLLVAYVNIYEAGGSKCGSICYQGPTQRVKLPKDPTTATFD